MRHLRRPGRGRRAGGDEIGVAVDELTDITGVDEEQARALIMKAREHWFAA